MVNEFWSLQEKEAEEAAVEEDDGDYDEEVDLNGNDVDVKNGCTHDGGSCVCMQIASTALPMAILYGQRRWQ